MQIGLFIVLPAILTHCYIECIVQWTHQKQELEHQIVVTTITTIITHPIVDQTKHRVVALAHHVTDQEKEPIELHISPIIPEGKLVSIVLNAVARQVHIRTTRQIALSVMEEGQ